MPPRSHDLNVLETCFAHLQDAVGRHFLKHPGQVSHANLIRKVQELWPQCHQRFVSLLRNQPSVLEEIYLTRGQGTGR